MKLSRFAGALVAVVLVTSSLFAAEDLTGKWSGTFVATMNGGSPDNDAAHMVLKQTGTELTGTAGPSLDRQMPIQKGTILVAKIGGKDTTKVSFDVPLAEGPVLHFDLELIDGHLKGKANAEQDGIKLTAVVDVTRVK